MLEFTIEKEILDHFEMDKSCKNYETATALCLMNYIKNKSFLKIEHRTMDFELLGSKHDGRFLVLTLVASSDFSATKEIMVVNRCFLEHDQKFENRIIIQSDGFEKSYRLNQEHTEVTVDIKA